MRSDPTLDSTRAKHIGGHGARCVFLRLLAASGLILPFGISPARADGVASFITGQHVVIDGGGYVAGAGD